MPITTKQGYLNNRYYGESFEKYERRRHRERMQEHMDKFGGQCRIMQGEGMRIQRLLQEHPETRNSPDLEKLRRYLLGAKRIVDGLLGVD